MRKRNVFTGVTKWNLRTGKNPEIQQLVAEITWSNQGFLYNIPSFHGALCVVINAQLSWGPAAAGGGLDFDWGVAPPWFFSLSVADLNLMLVNHCPVCAECSLSYGTDNRHSGVCRVPGSCGCKTNISSPPPSFTASGFVQTQLCL